MANTIYDLKLHELTFFTNKDDDVIKILRVPGGWIYSFLIKSESDTKMIFIPYNGWCYKQVCVAPAANLLIARVSCWHGKFSRNLI